MLILAIMLIGAINYNNSMAFLLSFLLGSMVLVSILHSYYNLHRLQIQIETPQAVHAGQALQLPIRIRNPTQTARYALQLTLQSEEKQDGIVTDIAQQADNLVKISVPTIQRGKLKIGRITLSSQFPIGLIYAWSYLHLTTAPIWIYPQLQGTQSLPEHTQLLNPMQHQANVNPQGDDFIGYRHYSPGESPRHVDWKIVAREQGWFIKCFGGETSQQDCYLRWQDVQDDDVEKRLSQLAKWVVEAQQQGLQYGLELPQQHYAPARGETHQQQCLLALAQYRA